MRQQKQSFLFDPIVRTLVKSGDAILAMEYQRQQLKNLLLTGEEREKLIDDVADRVISRIHVTLDASDLINKVNELDAAIDKLGK